jgi:peptide chain release factor 1
MIDKLLPKLRSQERRYEELTEMMGRPEIVTDFQKVQTLAKERASLERAVNLFREYKRIEKEIAEAKALVTSGGDADMMTMVKDELATLERRRDRLEPELQLAILPTNPNDEKNVIVEIRGGAGGDEAGIFAADLYRMYTRYAATKGWVTEVIDSNTSGAGGFKEIIFEVKGKGAYSRLKLESGVHRVQRVPETEASGRIHTSTATVAVLPEAEEVDIHIAPGDLKIDIFHAGGHGGQNVQKVATAVRITHLPTGIIATCQDERSQLKNKTKALNVLRTRLLDVETQKQEQAISSARRSQVGTGDRSEKIRTYNFPQNRITDHRMDVTLHNLSEIMDGKLDGLIDQLLAHEQSKRLEEATA